jgi:branched-chain amino acid transport system permease protein
MIYQVILNGLITGLLYGLVALGFSLIYSGTRIFHIAHGATYTIAAYLFLAGLSLGGATPVKAHWAVLALITLAVLILVSVLSVFVEILVYRPLYRRTAAPLVALISSLGLYIVGVNLIALFFGNDTKIFDSSVQPTFAVGPTLITTIQIIQFGVAAFTILSVFVLLKRTSLGRNIRALCDNPQLLGVLGLNPQRIRLLVFVIGSLLAASSSLLRAFDVGTDPHAGLPVVLTAAVAVIIGGIDSHWGAVLGALLLGVTQAIVVWFFSAEWQDAVTFVAFILVLFVRREGIVAAQLRLEER